MKKVNIILSTYNGEKYLPIQMDSLLNQSYPNITIYIRDDGSSDGTLRIIKEYQRQQGNKKIILLEDNEGNLGYVKSFMKIIRNCDPADYYAFCDQDDYWLSDKIERAVQHLSSLESDKCLLYTSAYAVCDSKLNVIDSGHEPMPLEELSVGKSLSLYDGGWLLGFTCVINDELRIKAFNNEITDMYSHDIWVQAVAVAMKGIQVYDKKVTAYFRRHENTTSVAETGMAKSVLDAWKYRWNETFGNGKMFERLKSGVVSFHSAFMQDVTQEEDILFLKLFVGDKGKLIKRIKKVFYPYRLKKGFFVEIAWRFAILLGKI
ncbi:glycosyltransferase [Faecalicatena contorta]|uniref:Glycosyl transferase family 2 n=1 Tax=Faecalicatena contorta TaxID=39482 RepID=A0A316AEL5_9FIRM|nr:glycosyltransferase [Faecalicatena contorta]PWJ48217.1 glycosyl transferase family 2 [Faecalicatena contorta]SUQ15493.1 Glycosyl transferase family 2 [Faecalicatena contorta]